MPTASTARTPSITRPGPIGSPAPRRMRAKCMMLGTSALSCASFIGRGSSLGQSLGADIAQQALALGPADARDVVLVLEQRPQRVVDRRRVEHGLVERDQRVGPVDRLGDAGQL